MLWYETWYIFPAAFALDLIFGDREHFPHPVRWMGRAIEVLEPRFRKIPTSPTNAGALFAACLIVSTWLLTYLLLAAADSLHAVLKSCLEIILIYFCISVFSLEEAAMKIKQYLQQKEIVKARENVALVVGRDVDKYGAAEIARATIETVAENLVDGVISPLFFAALGGAPLAMAYKMANTLDSMVGYKNETYKDFGKASAKIDDVLNYIPARLSVPVIAVAAHILSGMGKRSMRTAVTEGSNHSSPNAGYPEAAFAGALAVKLNRPNTYNGKLVDKPYIGVCFSGTSHQHIKKACDIMILSSLLWLLIVWGIGAVL